MSFLSRLRPVDRLILTSASVLTALIGVATVVTGLYPWAWLAGLSTPLVLAALGVFWASGALATGRRTTR